MLLAVLSGYALGLLSPLLVRVLKGATGTLLAALPAFLFAYFLQFLPDAAAGQPWRFAYAWGGPGGAQAAFRLDPLSLLFALLITLLSAVASLVNTGARLTDEERSRLLLALFFLMASALGCVLAATPVLVMSFLFLSSLAAFLLLTAKRGARARGALTPVLILFLAGDFLFILAMTALVLVPGAGPLVDLAHLPPTDKAVDGDLVVALMAGSLALRFVLVPVELAYGAPSTRRSAALATHCAAYLPVSLYLLIRFAVVLWQAPIFTPLLMALGAACGLAGALAGLRAKRLRTTLSAALALIAGLGLIHLAVAPSQGLGPVLLLLLEGGLGLALLFLASDLMSGGGPAVPLEALRGALRTRPFASAVLIFGALQASGVLPSLGLLTLTRSLGATLARPVHPAELILVVLGHALLMVVLWRPLRVLVVSRKETAAFPVPLLSLPASALSALGLAGFTILLVLDPAVVDQLFLAPVSGLFGASAATADVHGLWPRGITLALVAICLLLAGLTVWFEPRVARVLDRFVPRLPLHPWQLWRRSLDWFAGGARAAARSSLHIGFDRLAIGAACALGLTLVWLIAVALQTSLPKVDLTVLPLGALAALATLAALLLVFRPSPEKALPLMSIAGALAALAALAAGVVDLAYLMILVLVLETALLIILIPREPEPSPVPRAMGFQVLRAGLAVAIGGGAALIALLGYVPHGSAAAVLPFGTLIGSRMEQFQLWSGLVVLFLVLGVALSELIRRRHQGARA